MRYDQLVVWQGCAYEEKDKEALDEFFRQHHFHKPKIVGVVETLPTLGGDGKQVAGTGGRKDFFFFINNKDINRFSVWRLTYGMRWWEDIFYNDEEELYPLSFRDEHPPRW